MAPLRTAGFDPGWEHGVAQDTRKKKVKCNYCGKIVSGGIYRLKQHLARLSGEVTHCKRAPEEVHLKMKENLEGYQASKKKRKSDEEQATIGLHSNNDGIKEEKPVDYRPRGKQAIADKGMAKNLAPLRSLGLVDPGWEHGVAQDERKKKVKCNYCEKIVSGGINRFKQHLAKIPGEVAPCKKAPEEVFHKIKENMKWHRSVRRQRQPQGKETSTFYRQSFTDHDDDGNDDNDVEEAVDGRSKEKQIIDDKIFTPTGKATGKRSSRGRPPSSGTCSTEPQHKKLKSDYIHAMLLNSGRPSSNKETKLKTCSNRKALKEVISAICKFFYHAAVPFTAASSPYFQKMLDLVGQYGPGLKGPSGRMIYGQFLQDEIATIKQCQVEFKASWAITGCTIMADSWEDVQGRTLINLWVSCPRGAYFVLHVDASNIIEDATSLFRLLDRVVEEVGEENVVQVVTGNTASYRAAGKLLEEKRRSLFWTPCAAYSIDRVLEDLVKIKWVSECMDKGKKVTKFIYNCSWLLDLMRKEFTEGRDIVRPAVTRYATSFITLQSLLDHKACLKKMFQSNKWTSSHFAKLDEGKEVEKIVLNSTFWKKTQYVCKSVAPIMEVLQKVDSDEGLSMASIYNNIYGAKLAIKVVHGDDARKYGPFWSVIDNHWNSLFHHPLYAASYFLNPSYRHRSDFLAHPEVIRGLNECIVRLEPDNGRRVSASMQISDFVSAKADFGSELAIRTRTELEPAAWWQQHGINCLQLQRIAIRILSQRCSSFVCEHSWSSFDQMHSKMRNRLSQKRLNDLIHVHYNLRLRERQLRRNLDESISLDTILLESLLEDWILETEKPAFQENKVIPYNEMEQAEANENRAKENGVVKAEANEPMDTDNLGVVEPLQVHHPVAMIAIADNNDDDLDFLDDGLSD
ncbi:uncharacterized protein LOC131224790 isoform X1 [Magnolia sinica]|uniref:uncharacterized protein LOC131224790 isoform X1 n=1 Tax=Magnolia sinica TaxID=86752 RepID=UPI00265A64CF|nr:uncharacterized protein LOC131224790 isoform X1 [Magnolia sinica]XP_058076144.1 uncharacterized protein LOC131224790 isoform X1 [Magnolia sinica]XP_058076145.1 uncharacterized protein LOC131224790 isoform X1 [Magnolia sinica]XP_058076148.1 uncharacterized protein LOC131224790 isoform X1 [Magnolia sinica]XP_058076149.1 uncharacterized protein LOC131224790 isoform X1 [Magnolia sinica]XP_058076150.1 uncharacterized protein LOC131224790 isoform X1 [Magnolia sinica]XP_058076151.1 uncharacterize